MAKLIGMFKRSILPPTPILFACAIWFLHGSAVLAVQSVAVFQNSNLNFSVCLKIIFMATLFGPFILGSVLMLCGYNHLRIVMTVAGALLAFVEFVILVGPGSRAEGVVCFLFMLSIGSLIAATIIAETSQGSYKRWLVHRRRMRRAERDE